MIKSELVERILTTNPHLYQHDAEKLVNVILNEITGALSRGGRVEVRGFGAFSVKRRAARIGRNPRTGAQVQIGKKNALYFRPSKVLSQRLNKEG